MSEQSVSVKHNEKFTAAGVLIIDKPVAWTSHDVVARVRRLMKTRRVGHTGTLDPFATGVLVVCLNRATRLVQFLTGEDKEYTATMRLGFATDTGDLTGTPLSPPVAAGHIGADDVRVALNHFRGKIAQVPPMYSAKKIGGVKLYELARRGEEIERKPVEIEIKELELSAAAAPLDDAAPTRDFSFRVVCSSGTYIRTLAEDIGKTLGVGAHLVSLQRTRAGRCGIGQAVTLEHLAELADAGRAGDLLIAPAAALDMPEIRVTEAERALIAHGRAVKRRGAWRTGQSAGLCDERGELLAIGCYDERTEQWQPRIVLAGQ